MKYRIKITTFKNGNKGYQPYVKKLFFWLPLNYKGEIVRNNLKHHGYENRDVAFNSIDIHFKSNNTIQSIDFEYITK